MGQHESIFFFKADRKSLPSENENIDDWLQKNWDELRNKEQFYWVFSRRGSFHYGLCDICEELEISALDCIGEEQEINFLSDEALVNAQKAIHQVISVLSCEIPILTKTKGGRDTIWWLREFSSSKPYPSDTPQRAFAEAVVSHDLHDGDRDDCFYGTVICFFSFLKSLQQVVNEAVAAEQVFVFYKPLM